MVAPIFRYTGPRRCDRQLSNVATAMPSACAALSLVRSAFIDALPCAAELSGFVCFHPLIQPFLSDHFPAPEAQVSQFGQTMDFAVDHVLSVGFRAPQDVGDFFDG
jgi:hypothetical protein